MWETLPPELIKDVFLRMITFLLNNGLYLGHTWLLRSCKLSKLEFSCLNYISDLGIQGKASPLKLQEQMALHLGGFCASLQHWVHRALATPADDSYVYISSMVVCVAWNRSSTGVAGTYRRHDDFHGGNYPTNEAVIEPKVTVKPSNHRCQVLLRPLLQAHQLMPKHHIISFIHSTNVYWAPSMTWGREHYSKCEISSVKDSAVG